MNARQYSEQRDEIQSLWAATASAPQLANPLEHSCEVDVTIIGGGFTGLSTALHLAQSGVNVCLVESHSPGWGASGRNGGQVNPTLRRDPDDLARLLKGRAEPMIQAVSGSADLVFELIQQHNIDCHPVRAGWIQASYNEKSVDALYKRAQQWALRGAPVDVLDRRMISQLTGSDQFRGGWVDKRAGSVQPLSYARGLAAAASNAGAKIYYPSPVISLKREGHRWVSFLANGVRISSDHVVVATNAYTGGLWPGLARTVLAANSFVVATSPLKKTFSHVLPEGHTLSTSQRLLVYLRKDEQGRIVLGGRGRFEDPTTAADFFHIETALATLYPELQPLDFCFRWAGRLAITQDGLPHVHRPAPGMTIALGYNGRGIATATAMGSHISKLLVDNCERDFPFPITTMSPIPLHNLQKYYLAAGVAWYAFLDKLRI